MRTALAVAGLLGALAACGTDAPDAPDTSDVGGPDAKVPAGLESGCPSEQTRLRLAAGPLPSGAVGVRLCPGKPLANRDGTPQRPDIQGPVDELTSDVASLIDLVNDLPQFDPDRGCPLDAGPNVVYWFRYPDGDAHAVSYGEYGCHTVTVGESRERLGGERLATAFADALLAQRAEVPPPEPTEPGAAPECGMPLKGPPFTFLPQVPLDMTNATLCRVVGPNRVRSALIPTPLLSRINDRLLSDDTGRSAECQAPRDQSIAGVNTWGDRVLYDLNRCHLNTRIGYGREQNFKTLPAEPDIVAALASLPLSPVERWDK